ncbi:MAG: FG-GAP repeat protein, partial [Dehalococcoidia bacterium]|nr:FG-GAP repeat protein [Dehalococcoidia bacterium]
MRFGKRLLFGLFLAAVLLSIMAAVSVAWADRGTCNNPSLVSSLTAQAEPYNWTAESDQASAYFGRSVASAGDVNGDGYDDVIVGAYLFDNGQTDEGRAFVYHGSASGLSTSPDWTAESDMARSYFGYCVGTAGDVNGDGYDDVIISAPRYGASFYEGRVYVYLGSAAGLGSSPSWTVDGTETLGEFGSSVGSAGDVNGDGYADVIVGAYLYDNGESNEGRAFVYCGSASGLSTTP